MKKFYAVFKNGQLILLSNNSRVATAKFLGFDAALDYTPNII